LKLKTLSKNYYERSLFFVTDEDKAFRFLSEFIQNFEESNDYSLSGLIVTAANNRRTVKFEKIKKEIENFKNIRTLALENISTVLGVTVDFLFIDMQERFDPNKVCVLFETVRGGGVIFLLGKPPLEWIYSVNRNLFPLNNKTESRKSILLDWFLLNIHSQLGISNGEISSTKMLKQFEPMPYKINLNNTFKDFNVTSDQKRVIFSLVDDLLSFKKSRTCSVLLANRGRGKSATVGIVLSQLASHRKNSSFKVIISAPYSDLLFRG
jgi:tRNA(Met) C34 N-acetyltransferase TmcA